MRQYLSHVVCLGLGALLVLSWDWLQPPGRAAVPAGQPDTVWVDTPPPPPEVQPYVVHVPYRVVQYTDSNKALVDSLRRELLLASVKITPAGIETYTLDTAGRGMKQRFVLPPGGHYTIDHAGRVVETEADRKANRKALRRERRKAWAQRVGPVLLGVAIAILF